MKKMKLHLQYLSCRSSCSTNSHSFAFSEAVPNPRESGASNGPAVWKTASVPFKLVSYSCGLLLILGVVASGRLLAVLSAGTSPEKALVSGLSIMDSRDSDFTDVPDLYAVSLLSVASLTESCSFEADLEG